MWRCSRWISPGGAAGLLQTSCVAHVGDRGMQQRVALYGQAGSLELEVAYSGAEGGARLRGARGPNGRFQAIDIPDGALGALPHSDPASVFCTQSAGPRLFIDAIRPARRRTPTSRGLPRAVRHRRRAAGRHGGARGGRGGCGRLVASGYSPTFLYGRLGEPRRPRLRRLTPPGSGLAASIELSRQGHPSSSRPGRGTRLLSAYPATPVIGRRSTWPACPRRSATF